MEELLIPFHLRLLSAEARQRGEVLTLRLVCPCGRIHQIFDSALHGYDAVCGELRGLSPEECANAFGCIRLCSLGGQRRVLFEHESA